VITLVILEFLFAVFVFPGFLFVFLGSMLFQWYVRKLYAKMQNRIGPKFVGPFGLWQPFYDFFKLLYKESITPRYGRAYIYAGLMGIGIGSNVALLMFLPISPFRIQGYYDVIIFAYLALWSTLALAFASLMFPNPFSTLGASRLLSLMLLYEPTWILSVLVPLTLAMRRAGAAPFSVFDSVEKLPVLLSDPLCLLLLMLSLAAAILSLQCKLGLKPFDIFEAETEILAGVYTEFSGAKLAFAILFHDVEVFAFSLLSVFLFLGGPAPFTLYSVEGVVTIFVKWVLLVAVLTIIKVSSARFRVDQAIVFLRYPLILALSALVIALLI